MESFDRALDAVRYRAQRFVGRDEGLVAAAPIQGPGELLAARLRLDPDDEQFLWAVVAATADPALPAILATVPGREGRRGISVAQFATLYDLDASRARALAGRLAERSPVVVHELVIPEHEDPCVSTGFIAARRTISFLAGDDRIDTALSICGGLVPHVAAVLEPAHRAIAIEIAAMMDHDAMIVIHGQRGSGRKTLAKVAADRELVYVDLGRGGATPMAMRRTLAALGREATLRNAIPLIAGLDHLDGAEAEARRRELASFVDGWRGVVIGTSTAAAPLRDLGRPVVQIAMPAWSAGGRRQLWQCALGTSAAADTLDLVADRFHVGPGAIVAAAGATALQLEASGRAQVEVADIARGLGATLHDEIAGLARHTTSRLGWDDVVLADDIREQLELFVARARHGFQVRERWGIGRLLPSAGVAALFTGPPGTGKTMVASLVARDLGLELYRVDLAQITSKWVGETEKQLDRVFSAAETGHAMLLFDEADSLFAKRTEVKGASERYANLEVNFLLQRLESFDGVAILTTNLDTSIDPAFRRRMACHVHFPTPDGDERALLWRRMIPDAAPLADDVDLDELADRFDAFSGAHIRNAVVAAAFMAARAGTTIDHDTLTRAAADEARAMGRVVHSTGGLS